MPGVLANTETVIMRSQVEAAHMGKFPDVEKTHGVASDTNALIFALIKLVPLIIHANLNVEVVFQILDQIPQSSNYYLRILQKQSRCCSF